MISCRELTRRAADGSLEELRLRERLEVRFHLFLCASCRRYVAQMRALGAAVREVFTAEDSAEEDPAFEDLEDTILESLRRSRPLRNRSQR